MNAQQAAQDIVALINTSPRSPRQDEIEAIIAKHRLFANLLRQRFPMEPDAPLGDVMGDPIASSANVDRPRLSPEHLEYRRLVAEIEKYNEPQPGEPDGEKATEASEAAMGRLNEKITAIERKVWATPARTLADVLLRGEIALYNENGVMDSLDDPNAYYDERAVAQLIRAVVDVLGGLHAR